MLESFRRLKVRRRSGAESTFVTAHHWEFSARTLNSEIQSAVAVLQRGKKGSNNPCWLGLAAPHVNQHSAAANGTLSTLRRQLSSASHPPSSSSSGFTPIASSHGLNHASYESTRLTTLIHIEFHPTHVPISGPLVFGRLVHSHQSSRTTRPPTLPSHFSAHEQPAHLIAFAIESHLGRHSACPALLS